MAKFASDEVLDSSLDKIATSVTQTICSAQPGNYAGIAAVALASQTLTAGDGNGDYTIANGDTSGRKITIAQQVISSAASSGTATHVVYDDGTTLLFGTTCTSQSIIATSQVTVPAHDYEIADPA